MPNAINVRAFLSTLSSRVYSLPVVIFYVTEGCNLQCISCSYRKSLSDELSLSQISELAADLHKRGLRHIVFSGGEPLLRRDFPEICEVFSRLNVRQTMLTNGLLLEKRYDEVREHLSEIIVSLDGATAGTHNAIRIVESFDQILKGIRKVVSSARRPAISIRTVLQKKNFRELPEMVELARSLTVDRISFLAADVLSESFGRDTRGQAAEHNALILDEHEVNELRALLDTLFSRFPDEFSSKFISESPRKMLHILHYYEALLGKSPFPQNTCNAPNVSLVITSTGTIQPCFFLPAIGDVRKNSLGEMLNSPALRSVRNDVKAYSLERCKTCVCTLHVNSLNALFNRF